MSEKDERRANDLERPVDDLVAEMREQAEAERKGILDDARTAAAEIELRAQKECDRIEQAAMAEVDRELKAERDRILGEVRAEYRVERLKEKRAAVDRVRGEAEATIFTRVGGDGYYELLEMLIAQGIDFAGPGGTVRVADDDLEECRRIAASRTWECTVEGGAARRGDLTVVSSDGGRRVDNGLSTRLERVIGTRIADVARALFE